MTIEQLNSADDYFTAYVQVNPLRDPEKGAYPFTYWLSYSYAYGDLVSSVLSVIVPAKAIVLRVLHQVVTAFTGVTAMIVGIDDDDADGFIETGVITPGSAGDTVQDYNAAYIMTSRYFTDDDTVDITQTGTASAGTGKIFIEVLSYFEDLTDT